jgi:cellulase/cellobiase CelA1
LTFQTARPATSTCAVRYTETTNWGNGFVANVDVTNTGTQPIDSWTLTFTWPTTWQHADSGWNANWSQSGTTVTVTNVEGNRVLAPGATTSAGFVGSYQGPDVQPTSFTLNGVLCSG